MNKDRIIADLQAKLEEAEDEIEYNLKRKGELKNEIEDLKEQLKDSKDMTANYFDQCASMY